MQHRPQPRTLGTSAVSRRPTRKGLPAGLRVALSNLVLKFQDSAEKASCSILGDEDFKSRFKKKKEALKQAPRALTAEDSGEWVPIVAFEARGMDVTKFHLGRGDLVVHSEGDAIFDDVDLGDGDWADYDADADCSVSITDATTKVELVR